MSTATDSRSPARRATAGRASTTTISAFTQPLTYRCLGQAQRKAASMSSPARWGPPTVIPVGWYVDGGASYRGILGRNYDSVGFAVAYARIGSAARARDADTAFFTGQSYPIRSGETAFRTDLSDPAGAVVAGAARSAIRHCSRWWHSQPADAGKPGQERPDRRGAHRGHILSQEALRERSMGQLSPRWTLAGMEARGCLMGARLAISAAQGLRSLGLLTPPVARIAFRVSSRLDRASVRIWRRARTRRRMAR